MTDRELLEAAARAAGWKGWRSKHGYWNLTAPDGAAHVCCKDWQPFDPYTGDKLPEPTLVDAVTEVGWSPLTDDGDALRLAVALRISIIFNPDDSICAAGPDEDGRDEPTATPEACRRAIVRAAAAMAKEQA